MTGATVLLVEATDGVRETAGELLASQGYQVLSAPTPEQALQLSARHEGEIHLLLCDVVMPGMSGMDLADRLLGAWPNMRVLFMTGFSHSVIVDQNATEPGDGLLEKPFTAEALTARVQEVLGAA